MEPTTTPTPTRLTVDVWADVLCPWCYLGEQRLSQAIDEFPHGEHVELRVHTFQLDPQAPTTVTPVLTYLADKYGKTPRRPGRWNRTWPTRPPPRACATRSTAR